MDMLTRLEKICDNSHYKRRLYPAILEKFDNKRLQPSEVAKGLRLIFQDYSRGMPPIMAKALEWRSEDYIRAVCETSQDADKAIRYWNEVDG